MAEVQLFPPTRPLLPSPPEDLPLRRREKTTRPPVNPIRLSLGGREATPRQRVLFCRCGSLSVSARGLCSRCYARDRADRLHFAGLRDQALRRDRYTCRGCRATAVESVLAVHHRQPGVSELDLLVTLCPGCHAVVERTAVLFRDLPELLRVLWRELHPAASEQLPLFSGSGL